MTIVFSTWLRGLTVGLILGAVLGAATVSRGAFGRGDADLGARVAALEALTQDLSRVEGPVNGLPGPHLFVTGVNLHVRNGSGTTIDEPNGLGNLIVGYNEIPTFGPFEDGDRDGSHNLVIGSEHRYTAAGGLVAGYHNATEDNFASVSGGQGNVAGGTAASISGGLQNETSGPQASISGGFQNSASGASASVSGGEMVSADTTTCWRAGALFQGCP